ncbi:MAG TPA: hypothetical protein VIV11_32880 [Kofleriaceae bacterium]
MNKLVAIAIVAVAAPAAADPCDVRIKYAPEDVREVVTSWLLDEPSCGPALEIRIVATEAGLYVFARDAGGRTRERVVPDAQSAGVLIASWAAADATVIEPAPAREPAPAMTVELSYTPAQPRDTGVAQQFTPKRRVSRDKTLAVHGFGNAITTGVRAELDLWRKGPWFASLTASFAHDGHTDWENRGHDVLDYFDTRALASFGVVGEDGPLQLRWSISGGGVATYVRGTSYFDDDPLRSSYAYGWLSAAGLSPTFETNASLGARVSKRWLLEVGALASVLVQEYEVPTMMGHTDIEARGFQLMWFTGLRRTR